MILTKLFPLAPSFEVLIDKFVILKMSEETILFYFILLTSERVRRAVLCFFKESSDSETVSPSFEENLTFTKLKIPSLIFYRYFDDSGVSCSGYDISVSFI